MVEFGHGERTPGGGLRVRHVRTISQSSIGACPHFILDPSHYRDDETCKCDDPNATEMADWGYTWDAAKGQWT